MIKRINLFLYFLLPCFITLNGCSYAMFKDYSFSEPIEKFEIGKVYGKLLGHDSQVPNNITERKSPYDLLVRFQSETEQSCEVIVKFVSLVNISNNKVLFSSDKEISVKIQKGYKGMYYGRFHFDRLNLEHKLHQLNIQYVLNKSSSEDNKKSSIKMIFKPDYKEKEISLWDIFLGV